MRDRNIRNDVADSRFTSCRPPSQFPRNHRSLVSHLLSQQCSIANDPDSRLNQEARPSRTRKWWDTSLSRARDPANLPRLIVWLWLVWAMGWFKEGICNSIIHTRYSPESQGREDNMGLLNHAASRLTILAHTKSSDTPSPLRSPLRSPISIELCVLWGSKIQDEPQSTNRRLVLTDFPITMWHLWASQTMCAQ